MKAKGIAQIAIVSVAMMAGTLLDSAEPVASPLTVNEASFGLLPKFKTGKKVYDSLGKWIGCVEGSPKQCVMMTLPLTDVFVSDEGVLLK